MNKNQFLMIIITTFLAISVVFISADTNSPEKVETLQPQPSSIYISGNADLIAQARQYGWDLGGERDGSVNFPFQINDLNLVSNGELVVFIQNTNLYVNIDTVMIDGQNLLATGMNIYNVSNLSVLRAQFINIADGGTMITIGYSMNVRIIASQLYSSNAYIVHGIESTNSNYTMIYSNTFTGIPYPIILDNGNNSRIEGNYFYDNLYNDINVYSSERVSIQDNTFNNSDTAISLVDTYLTFVRNNIINNSRSISVAISQAQQIRFFNNVITNSSYSGIAVQGSNDSVFAMNDIRSSTDQAIYFDSFSSGNLIKWNNFIDNRNGGNQGIDDGINNYFVYNYFNDHVGNDVNLDNYEDTPYYISGAASNIDDTPLSLEHIEQATQISEPNRLSQFTGTGTITWSLFSSNYITDYTIGIFYRSLFDSQWILITANYVGTSFTWDVSGLDDGQYQVRIVTSFPLYTISTSDTSREFFVRNNHLSLAKIFRPNGGEILNTNYEIRWRHSFDIDGHAVHYSVSISHNDGTTWKLLQSNLLANYFVFDFGVVDYGDQYLIKVVADDGVGNMVTDVSDGVFTAGTPITTTITPTTTVTDTNIGPPTETNTNTDTNPPDTSNSTSGPALPVPNFGIQILFLFLVSFAFLRRKHY